MDSPNLLENRLIVPETTKSLLCWSDDGCGSYVESTQPSGLKLRELTRLVSSRWKARRLFSTETGYRKLSSLHHPCLTHKHFNQSTSILESSRGVGRRTLSVIRRLVMKKLQERAVATLEEFLYSLIFLKELLMIL